MYLDIETKKTYERIGKEKFISTYTGKVLDDSVIQKRLFFLGIQFDGLVEAKKMLPRKRTYFILQDVETDLFHCVGAIGNGKVSVILTNDYKESLLYYDFDMAFSHLNSPEEDEIRIRKLVYDTKKKEWLLSDWGKDYSKVS